MLFTQKITRVPPQPWQGLVGFGLALVVVVYLFAKASGFGLNYLLGWQGIGVDAMTHFYDLDLTYKAAQYLFTGHNPYADGAFNPTGTLANYPPALLWVVLVLVETCGSVQSLGLLLGALSLVVVTLLACQTTLLGGFSLGLGLGLGSGALAIERGNTDLLIFLLLLASIAALSAIKTPTNTAKRSWLGGWPGGWLDNWLGGGLLLIAAMLKLFPAAAALVLLLHPVKKSRWAILAFVVAFGLYLVWLGPLLFTLVANTAITTTNSYGISSLLSVISQPAALVLVPIAGIALYTSRVWLSGLVTYLPPGSLFLRCLCLAGASIFMGTYLAGASFNYRLVFALLCLPLWFASGALWRGTALCLTLFMLWPAVENNIFWYLPHTYKNQYYVALARQALGLWVLIASITWIWAHLRALLRQSLLARFI